MARKTTTRKQPAELGRLQGRFESWRATRQTRRIPEGLWEEAVAAARRLGVHRTSQALRLNFDTLKRRVQERRRSQPRARTEAFVDVTPEVSAATTVEGSADFQLPNGGRLRLSWRGAAPDLEALTRTLGVVS